MSKIARIAEKKQAHRALKFNNPELFWDPLMRAAALGRMGGASEARSAIVELLGLIPDFASSGPRLIGRYVKVDELIDELIEGLQKAGLGDLE